MNSFDLIALCVIMRAEGKRVSVSFQCVSNGAQSDALHYLGDK